MKQYNTKIKGKLFNYFKGRLNIKQSTKGWWRCDCIWCGGKYSMGIHLEQSKVHCFKCADAKSPVQLLMEIEGFKVMSQAHEFLNIQQEYDFYESTARGKPKEVKPIELPEAFTLLSQGDSIYGKAARSYMKGRGFNIDRLSLKGIGYCTEGEYSGYIIFPFYRKGKLIYFQGRKYLALYGPKMKNPPSEQFGIGKETIIYNQDALYIYNKVYTVESITNAETLGEQAIATLGKSISPYQLYQIISAPCKSSVMILDPDAYKEAIESAMQIVNYKKVKVIKLEGDKDVNDLGKVKTMEFVTRTPYQDYNELFRLKLNINGQRPIATYQKVGPYKIDRRGA